MPCKRGFYIFNNGNTFDREASKVKLKNSNKADYKYFSFTKRTKKRGGGGKGE